MEKDIIWEALTKTVQQYGYRDVKDFVKQNG